MRKRAPIPTCEEEYPQFFKTDEEQCWKDTIERLSTVESESSVDQYFNNLREECKKQSYVEKYSSVEDCFNARLPLYDVRIRETP